MPVFRSTWCGRFSSPVSLSSWKELGFSAWCERRMFRRDGEVLRLGTAIGGLFGGRNGYGGRQGLNPSAAGERGLMHETPRAINPPGLDFTASAHGEARCRRI